MVTDPGPSFLLVRSEACLARASEDLRAYQSCLRRRSPSSRTDLLQGIWVDEDDVVNVPGALVLPDTTGVQRTVRIQEAAGINGVWMWSWLEALVPSVTRTDLVAALLAAFGRQDADTLTPRFIPVFAIDAPDSVVSAEWQALDARYPGLVRPAIRQDGRGGLLPAEPPPLQGTTT